MKTISVIFILGAITIGSTSGDADFMGQAYRRHADVIRNGTKFPKRFKDVESIRVSTESLKTYFGDLLQDRFDNDVISNVIDSLNTDEDGFVDLQELGEALARFVTHNQGLIQEQILTVLDNFHLNGYLKRFFRRNGAAIKTFLRSIPNYKDIMSAIREIAEQSGIETGNLKSYLPILQELVQKNAKSVIEAIKSSLENLPKLIDLVPEALDFIEKNGDVIIKAARNLKFNPSIDEVRESKSGLQ